MAGLGIGSAHNSAQKSWFKNTDLRSSEKMKLENNLEPVYRGAD